MKNHKHKILTLFAILLLSHQIFAQRVLRGGIIDINNVIVPGANIMVKGTQRSTNSALNGFYSIQVNMGDTLVISYIGKRTREIKITTKSFKNFMFHITLYSDGTRAVKLPITYYYTDPIYILEANKFNSFKDDNNGVAFVDTRDKRILKYRRKKNSYGDAIVKKIKYDESLKTYVFKLVKLNKKHIEHFEFNSTFSLDKVTRLPKFQNTYSQGTVENEQFVYTSPIENNFLCWGPAISQLEFDGQNSPYYQNGNIVRAGLGNGVPLASYKPSNYFRNGLRFINSLEYKITNNNHYVYVKYNNTNNTGIMPEANFKGHSFSMGIKTGELDARAFYTNSKGKQNLHEGNYARIMHALYTTPPEFDNANGYSGKLAVKKYDAYLTADNNQRSYSTSLLENPYWYAANDPSKMKSQHYGLNISYQNYFQDNWKYLLATSYQKEESDNTTGFVSFYTPQDGTVYNQTDNNLNFNGRASIRKKFDLGFIEIDNYLRYIFSHNQYEYKKNNYTLSYAPPANLNQGEQLTSFLQKNRRSVNEIVTGLDGDFFYFPLDYAFSLNIYQSSTCKYVQFLPNAKLMFDIGGMDNLVGDRLRGIIYFQYIKSISETDFQNRPNHYNTINFDASDFRNYAELKNVLINEGIKPTVTNSVLAGINLRGNSFSPISLSANYYHKQVSNAIFPMQTDDYILISNQANIINHGFELHIAYHRSFYSASLLFSQAKNIVNKIYSGATNVAIAGFADVYKSLVAGEEVGVIVGSRYSRNEDGQLIIGNDGYPMVDPTPGVIGNPNPDWIVNFNNSFSRRHFMLSLNFEYKHGGQVWNGTKNVLNYHGVSQQSADSRNVNGYIFEGVDQNGEPNTIPVDFANPADGINQFRYLRNGYTGVAEDAIEDASWFRLRKVAFSYRFLESNYFGISISGIRLSCWIENVFMITPYSGVDPRSSLFGYDAAQGLDLFNAPGTRRIGFSLKVTF